MLPKVLPTAQGKNPYAPQLGVHRPPYYWEYKSHAYGIDFKPQKRTKNKKKAENIAEEKSEYTMMPAELAIEYLDA